MDRDKIIKMVAILAIICAAVGMLARVSRQNRESLVDYAESNPDLAYSKSAKSDLDTDNGEKNAENSQKSIDLNEKKALDLRSNLTGALLNASLPTDEYTLYSEGFYYAPISDNLEKYITGKSYPKEKDDTAYVAEMADLRYVHVWHFDLEGNPVEGELICNKAIAQDLAEIFCELYRNKYRIGSILLPEEFDENAEEFRACNNSFCFYYSDENSKDTTVSHAYGLAVDINPFYNPCISYGENGEIMVAPTNAEAYADRTKDFPYKIDETDLCYKLFAEHGFIWGGNSNAAKEYQHFEASLQH